MSKMENKWVVEKDNLSILLPNFYVTIACPVEDDDSFYKLQAMHVNKTLLGYHFDSLGDAMYFTEHSIAKSETVYDVIDEYKKHFIFNEEKTDEEDDFNYSYVFKKNNRKSRF